MTGKNKIVDEGGWIIEGPIMTLFKATSKKPVSEKKNQSIVGIHWVVVVHNFDQIQKQH